MPALYSVFDYDNCESNTDTDIGLDVTETDFLKIRSVISLGGLIPAFKQKETSYILSAFFI